MAKTANALYLKRTDNCNQKEEEKNHIDRNEIVLTITKFFKGKFLTFLHS
jgi:hypothetical protein